MQNACRWCGDLPPCGVHETALGAAGAGEQRVYVATTEQVWQLYEIFPEHMRLAVLLGAFVGLRLAEACGLRIEDIDFFRAGDQRPLM